VARHRHGKQHGRPRARGRSARGRYGNPADLARFLARQESPERAAWQKPSTVIRALALERGATVADLGAGPGYFSMRLARAVGRTGHVYAVDPEPVILDVLRNRLRVARASNVTPVLGRADDPLLPESCCDVALLVNAYHHLDDGPRFLRRVRRVLKPRGRLVNIDFDARETPVGPPVEHRIERERFLHDAGRAGFRLAAEHRFLPYQYFLVLRVTR
jgi:ubiquinone/menaquinone biosynthesis C-methylase UbiE